MSRARTLARSLAPWLALGIGACDPVEGTSLSRAPQNLCADHPCDAYAPGPRTKPVCNGTTGTCEIQGRPDYPFTIVVSVPSSSFYAPGSTFYVPSSALYDPPKTTPRGQCSPPTCLSLPTLIATSGTYAVLADAIADVGFPRLLPDKTSLPLRVQFVPLASPGVEALAAGFPADITFAASELGEGGSAIYQEPVPAGQYLRAAYPEPPYDAFFPPVLDEVTIGSSEALTVGASGNRRLDDPTGDARRARVRRAEGLDGFRIWLADTRTGRRVSVVRTLTGVDAETRLDTIGQSQGTGTALRDNIDVVVAPPDTWIGVPRLASTLIGGQGLRDLVYPALAEPASLSGVVAKKAEDGALIGIPSQITFESSKVYLDDGTPSPLLQYKTALATDEAGRFATVLPPGVYDAIIEPAEGTGYGKVKKVLDVTATRGVTFEPPVRTVATGRAVLSDGRSLASAQILAMPSNPSVQTDKRLVPRAARARTDADGQFRIDLDQGSYDLSVVPEAGTGFPRLVTIRGVGAEQADVGTLTVPVPVRVPLTIRAPTVSESPIARAIVRIFAQPVGGGPAVEVASAMTDSGGKCQILLAQQPR